jgi:hypothetical protein
MSTMAGLAIRATTVLCLLAPTAFVALRSPLLLLAVPTLGWRFVSGNPAYWGMDYHYSAVLMPIVFVAFVDGLARLGARDDRTSLRGWAAPACLTATALLLVVQLAHPPRQPQWTDAEVASAREALTRIPDGAGVAASNRLAPQLTGRCRVQLFPPLSAAEPLPEWVAVARPFSWPAPAEVQESRVADLRADGYEVVTDLGHVTLLHRRAP